MTGGVRIEADSLTVRARRAIIALPPTLAGRLVYDPPLPARRDHLAQRMPHGAVVKFAAVYDEPFWRREGLNGQAASDAGPVTLTFDGSPPSGALGILVGYVRGRHAVELGEAGPAWRRAAVLGCLRRFFGGRTAASADYLDLDWSAEEWTRGCYGGNAVPGTLTRFGPALRAAVGPLHWAGSEIAYEWVGYMDGAIEAGERAAEEIRACSLPEARTTTARAVGGLAAGERLAASPPKGELFTVPRITYIEVSAGKRADRTPTNVPRPRDSHPGEASRTVLSPLREAHGSLASY